MKESFQFSIACRQKDQPESVNSIRNRLYDRWHVRVLLMMIIFTFAAPGYSIAQSTIKIGLLIRDKNDFAAQQAAAIAIETANARGGYKGKKFELRIRACDGPWGIGSKQAVALIHEDSALILVGALDGRNAHLAEQVSAKSHVVMLSTLSSDPTLSRAYVPWYFRMVPDDKQQAEVLAELIYSKNKAKKVAVVALDNYDGKMSAEAFLAAVKVNAFPDPEVFIALNDKELLEKTGKNPWDAIVIAGTPKQYETVLNVVKSQNTYAFINIFNFTNAYQAESMKNIRFVNQAIRESEAWLNFQTTYRQKFNTTPSPAMAYVYDGIMLACEAVKKLGHDTEAIKKGFKGLKYQGITGKVEFGKLGNRDMELK